MQRTLTATVWNRSPVTLVCRALGNLRGQRTLACLAFLLISIGGAQTARAGDVFLNVGGAIPQIDVASVQERKFSTVTKQQYDFSCGSAALSTLLTHHYGIPTTETEAFEAMWRVGDKKRIEKLGFSLLEMKSYLESINLKADGFKITTDRLSEIGVPGIALIDVRGYRHFVVVKGITKKTILLGDPSVGVVSVPRSRFEKRWDGVILFIRSELSRGKANFNKLEDWRLTPGAPHDRALEIESLQSQLLVQTRSGFFPNVTVGAP
ncbi:MAG: C39 family peptidase [Pseudomonadota bacterium]